MLMYRIIGSDQRLYGPISDQTIRQWIAEGRVNASTVIQADGSAEWKRLSEYPEFAQPAAAEPPLQSPPPAAAPAPSPVAPLYVGQPSSGNGAATAGFIFGLLSACCCCGTLFGTAGLVLSVIGLNRSKQLPNDEGKALATAGIVLSIIGLVAGTLSSLFFVIPWIHGNPTAMPMHIPPWR